MSHKSLYLSAGLKQEDAFIVGCKKGLLLFYLQMILLSWSSE